MLTGASIAMVLLAYSGPAVAQSTAVVFGPPSPYESGGDLFYHAEAAVMNLDQTEDLILSTQGVNFLLNDGFGALLKDNSLADPQLYAKGVAAGDLDGDGVMDLAVVNSDIDPVPSFLPNLFCGRSYGVNIYIGRPIAPGEAPNLQFVGCEHIPPVQNLHDVVAGDLDEDGTVDLAVSANGGSSGAILRGTFILLGHGDGTFASVGLDLGFHGSLSAGDVDHDGHLDVAGDNGLAYGAGDGHFVPADLGPSQPPPGKTRIGDIDGDGFADLVLFAPGGDSGPLTMSTHRSGFQKVTGGNHGSAFPETFTLADLNNDGLADVVTVGGGDVMFALSHGDGTLGPTHTVPVYSAVPGDDLTAVKVADWNNDGYKDIAVVDYRNHGQSPSTTWVLLQIPGADAVPPAFDQTVFATDRSSFAWTIPEDVIVVRGDLALVSTYGHDIERKLIGAARFHDSFVPAAGRGLYYLVRTDRAGESWQTSPGVEPGRDAVLP